MRRGEEGLGGERKRREGKREEEKSIGRKGRGRRREVGEGREERKRE